MTGTGLPLCVVIMDGYGVAPPGPGNAIAAAHTPVLDGLFARWPNTRLVASGEAVGLPAGQMGNSEVGHLAIGAGRVVYQELTRISRAIEDGSFFRNEALIAAIDAALATQGAVHLMGLLSDGGVHSHREHLYALVRLARARGAERIFVHCFLDGRDVAPDSGAGFIEDLESFLGVGAERQGRVASVMGRYWAMDRDNRWERVEKAWNALVVGQGVQAANAREAVEASYAAGVTDEFVAPTVIMDGHLPVGRVCDGDAVIFFNFRPDRARQLTRAFVDPEFAGFPRTRCPAVHFVSLTEYDPKLPAPVAFEKDLPACVLADVLAANGLRQLHIAETEKYAHVTFFLNGGVEAPKRGEERVLVPSPHVATYDLQPEMSAPEVTAELVAAIDEGRADVYIVNYANCDMVGHTGVLAAAVKAVEVVDESLGKVVAAVERRAGALVVTADHGNAERMLDADGTRPFTAHTSAEVPLIVIDDRVRALVRGGMLPDVAPTVLDLLGIEPPDEWTARSLLIY